MKNLFILIVAVLYFFNNHLNAEQKIAIIDMDRVISTSKSGSSILKQLNDVNNKNLIFLKKQEKKFKEDETKLISQKNIISETDFEAKVIDLKSEINDHNEKRKKMITEFKRLKNENTNKLLKLINTILIKFTNENEISIILQKKNLVIGKTELDITEEVIKIINTEVKEFKIK